MSSPPRTFSEDEVRLRFPTAVAFLLLGWHISEASVRAGAPPPAKKPARLKVALVNLRCLTSETPDAEIIKANIKANLKRHFYFIDLLAEEGAEFIGFPELSLNGYRFSKTMTWLRLD